MHYYKVIHDFQAEDSVELSVHVNELLCAEQNKIQNGWIRVSVVNEPQRKGFVPPSYIREVESSNTASIQNTSNQSPSTLSITTPKGKEESIDRCNALLEQRESSSVGQPCESMCADSNQVSSPAMTNTGQQTPRSRNELVGTHYQVCDNKEAWRSTPSVSLEREYSLLSKEHGQEQGERIASHNDNNSSHNIDSTNNNNFVNDNITANKNNLQLLEREHSHELEEEEERYCISASRLNALAENAVRNEIYYKQLSRQRTDTFLALQNTLESTRKDFTACKERSSLLSSKLKELDNVVESNRDRLLQTVRNAQGALHERIDNLYVKENHLLLESIQNNVKL